MSKKVGKIYVTKAPGGGEFLSRKPIPKGKNILVSAPKQKGTGATLKAPPDEVFKLQASRSLHAKMMDDKLAAPVLSFEEAAKWLKAPNRYDLPRVDTKGSMGKVTTVRIKKEEKPKEKEYWTTPYKDIPESVVKEAEKLAQELIGQAGYEDIAGIKKLRATYKIGYAVADVIWDNAKKAVAKKKAEEPVPMTKAEWQKKPKDYKSMINGEPHILKMVEGVGTTLVPVKIIDEKPPKVPHLPTTKLVKNLIESGKPLIINDLKSLIKYGYPGKGYDAKHGETYLYSGAKVGVFTDGYILIEDKDAAKKEFDEIFKAEAKKIAQKKYTSVAGAKDIIRKNIAESGAFPDYKANVYPPDFSTTKELIPFAVYAGSKDVPFTDKYSAGAALVYFTNKEGQIIPVSADRLARLYKHFPNAKIVSQGPSYPLFFMVDGQPKGAVMPMLQKSNFVVNSEIETAAQRAMQSFVAEAESPAKPAAKPATEIEKKLTKKVEEIAKEKAGLVPGTSILAKLKSFQPYIALDAEGKPLIKVFNVTNLKAAAGKGIAELEKYSKELQDKMLSPSKKAAIEDVTNQLKAILKGEETPTETPSTSGEAEMIEAVQTGEQKLPKQTIPDTKTLNEQEKAFITGKKDWDADLEMVSGKKGTNEGGLYKDKKLQTFHYIKWPGEERARMEALAAALYQAANVPVPSVDLIKFGSKWAVKSDWIDGAETLTYEQMQKYPQVRDNFIVDAWLGNWDVVGTNADNIVKGGNGIPYRIDLGGSLIYRAQGKIKDFPPTKVEEIENMTNPMVATHASKVFGDITWAEKKKGAAAVAAITDHQIDEIVDAFIPDGFQISGYSPSNVNKRLKEILKARRDYIVENVLKYEPPKPVTAGDLKKLTALKEKNIKLILEHKDNLTSSGNSYHKQHVHDTVINDQLGPVHGPKAADAVSKNYGGWKGHTTGTAGQLLRWASAEYMGRGKDVRKVLEAHWIHKYGASSPTTKQELKDFDALIEKYGPPTLAGVGVNNEMHKILLRAQFTNKPILKGNKPKKVEDTVTLWRSWRPDQVSLFGWEKAKAGDQIEVPDPLIFSFSLTRHIADNFYSHGGKMVKVEVPIDNVLMSDRLTNTGGGYSHEDEALFVMPKGYTMEVVK